MLFFAKNTESNDYWKADAAGRNALTRAGFIKDTISNKLQQKLDETLLLEKQIEEIVKEKMTPDELEQYELLQEHEQRKENKK